MNWQEYFQLFDTIITAKVKAVPYDNPLYLEYTKLNYSRSKRWLKHSELTFDSIECLKQIKEKQNWILITEHWCGDAAHVTPIIYLLSKINPLIEIQIQLRDSNSEIDNYLTNGGKSIPKLIIRDKNNKDLITWGPRPKECQVVFDQLKEKNADFEEIKIKLQEWYNQDKSISIQKEICETINSII